MKHHDQTAHPKFISRNWKCHRCKIDGYGFISKQFHDFDYHRKGQWYCTKVGCNHMAPTRRYRSIHEATCSHPPLDLICKVPGCGIKFAFEFSLIEHLQDDH